MGHDMGHHMGHELGEESPGGADGRVHGDGVVLRRLCDRDVDDLVAGCNDPLTQQFLPLLPSPFTRADATSWITGEALEAFARGGAVWAIADPESDRMLGGCGYGRVHAGAAEIGYWVAPWARGRGVATAAAKTIVVHAFGHGLQRLVLKTALENTASQRVAITLGFTRECVERSGGVTRDAGRQDLVVWSRLTDDAEGPTERLLPDLPGWRPDDSGRLGDGVVTLRPVRASDADDIFTLASLPDVVASSVPPNAPDRAEIGRRSARAEATWLAGQRAEFIISDAATGDFAGEIGLYYFEPPTQQAMIGYSMMPQWRGRGYATRAARLVAQWAFGHTGIKRLIAGTSPENIGSQRVLERAGFVREGYQRSRLPGANGTRIDDLLYALLPDGTGDAPSERRDYAAPSEMTP